MVVVLFSKITNSRKLNKGKLPTTLITTVTVGTYTEKSYKHV